MYKALVHCCVGRWLAVWSRGGVQRYMLYPFNLQGAYDLVRKIICTFLLDTVQVSEPGTLDHSLSHCAHNSVLLTLTSAENTQLLTM